MRHKTYIPRRVAPGGTRLASFRRFAHPRQRRDSTATLISAMTTRRALLTILATALLLLLVLPLRAESTRRWITKAGQDSNHPTLFILPSHLVSAGDIEEDDDREIPVVVPTVVESPRPMAWSSASARPGSLRPPMNKRQIRYHQCYFNPISCFG